MTNVLSQQTVMQKGEEVVREFIATRSAVARDRAVQMYLPLVKYIVGRLNIFENGTLKKDDFYQFGIIGLLHALDRYNPDYGVTFKTFAYKRIKGEIIDALRKLGKLNKNQIKRHKEIVRVEEELRTELGREPTREEICEKLEIPFDQYDQIKVLMEFNYTSSLDDGIALNSEGGLLQKEVIADPEQVPPHVALDQKLLKEEIKESIQQLPERERLILALYFYEELTLNDIGLVLDLSESRVSQILSKTLLQLKSVLKKKREG